MDMYDTMTMLQGMKSMKPNPTFLRDTFFPASSRDIYPTKKVMVDYEEESSEKLAPAVVKGSIPVKRGSFTTEEYTAPLVAPSRILSVEQLNDRTFNENIFTGTTPAQREARYLAEDISELEKMISRTEEYMAAQLMTTNEYTIRQYLDKYGTAGEDFHISFFGKGNATNQAVYTPQHPWTGSGADIIGDLAVMARTLKKKGRRADVAVLGAQAADAVIRDSTILSLLDNRRFNLADTVSPQQLPNGATFLMRINANGNILDLYVYDAQYTDNAGQDTYYIPADKVIVTSAGIGRTAHGAITQYEQGAKTPTTYAAGRVPHVTINEEDGVRSLALKSRPLVMPRLINPYICADVA